MPPRRIEAEIDRLYQLPPEEFTAARNLLAKQTGVAADVRGLAKPPIAAWAVNQLYWKGRPVYDALIDASESVRRTHAAVLGGKKGDLRAVGKGHEQAVDAALKAALAILEQDGTPATDATRQAIVTTLRALPAGGERPGRLTRILQPGGFEMLAGLSISGTPAAGRIVNRPPSAGRARAPQKLKAAAKPPAATPRDPKALGRAREAAARAARELRESEHVARRQEFEAARATREADKAVNNIEIAREALEAARQALAEAEAAAASSARTRESAERRSGEAERAFEAARAKAGAAAAALAQLAE